MLRLLPIKAQNQIELSTNGGLVEVLPFFEQQNRRPAIVIYEQVLEHIFNLDEELVQLKKLITPDTLIYIGVPGIRNLEHPRYEYDLLPFLQIPHLVHFDLQSLQKIMYKHGFELLKGNEQVRAIFQYKGKAIAPLKLNKNLPTMQIYLTNMEEKRAKRKMLKTIFFPYFLGKTIIKKAKGRIKLLSSRY